MMELPIRYLSSADVPDAFPVIDNACREPNGLLAAGGDLSRERLLYAYQHGIFPWYEDGQPILWWSPDPRCVLEPQHFHVARRFERWLRSTPFAVTFNRAFDAVVQGCAGQRMGQRGTWITSEMRDAYNALHRGGWAHSVEVWHGDTLVGGLYGLAIGKIYFGESMFSRESNASKCAMLALCQELARHKFNLIDCQVVSPHLLTLGAVAIPRAVFRLVLENACSDPIRFTEWPDGEIPVASMAPR
ncbi:MAG: leucyl/phenylalanyl-tRNA--protein transferase [Woeseia sp.]